MSGLDRLFAKSLDSVIRTKLGTATTKKIEARLFEKYGLSLTEAIEQFHKIDAILREFFGAGANGLEKKFLENTCKVKSKSKGQTWFSIEDDSISHKILDVYGDEEKTKIMHSVIDKPKIISEILDLCKIPQTSGYRKINALIKSGLLIVNGFVIASDGRKINKYRALFDNLRINIVKNKITVDVQLTATNYSGSSVMQVIYNR